MKGIEIIPMKLTDLEQIGKQRRRSVVEEEEEEEKVVQGIKGVTRTFNFGLVRLLTDRKRLNRFAFAHPNRYLHLSLSVSVKCDLRTIKCNNSDVIVYVRYYFELLPFSDWSIS